MNKNFRAIDWKRYLPIPICEEYPEYGEFYKKAWELARDHVKEIDGKPQNPYMDFGAFANTKKGVVCGVVAFGTCTSISVYSTLFVRAPLGSLFF